MKLIVGLGNPGTKYQNTRHNLGFWLLDQYAQKHLGPDINWDKNDKFKAEILKITPGVILIKPLTFMNNSGLAVKLISDYYQINPQDIVVVYDELDLLLGKLKVRVGGSSAGHQGIESIINSLGTDQFIRFRIGIGQTESKLGERRGKEFLADQYVLTKFLPKDRTVLRNKLKEIIEALDLLTEDKLTEAQNRFNL